MPIVIGSDIIEGEQPDAVVSAAVAPSPDPRGNYLLGADYLSHATYVRTTLPGAVIWFNAGANAWYISDAAGDPYFQGTGFYLQGASPFGTYTAFNGATGSPVVGVA